MVLRGQGKVQKAEGASPGEGAAAAAEAELGLEPGSSKARSGNFALHPCCSCGIFLFEKALWFKGNLRKGCQH